MTAPGRLALGHVPLNEQLYNHIVLPRDVPGREDKNLSNIEAALLARLNDATHFLSSRLAPSDQQPIHALCDSLTACQLLHVDRSITKPVLSRELREIKADKILILHISAQNCGLLVYKDPR